MITADEAKFLGKVVDWLSEAPVLALGYGEFHTTRVEVAFDGDPLGQFVFHDETWNYYPAGEEIPTFLRGQA